MKRHEIKSFLDDKAFKYESPSFINEDPIQIPHKFSIKEDIEISGILGANLILGIFSALFFGVKILLFGLTNLIGKDSLSTPTTPHDLQ